MYKEGSRLDSFTAHNWPHPTSHFNATPTKLAQSGFYLCPTNEYIDRTVCFCCGVALVHWNKESDPW